MDNAVVNIIHEDDTRIGLMVRAYAKEAASYCTDLHAVRRYVENCIDYMNPQNHVTPRHAYRASLSDDCKSVEVWHYNTRGDRDRLLLTVTTT
jgi:hypothetical protein